MRSRKAKLLAGVPLQSKHGMGKTRIYNAWNSMLCRCFNEKDWAYARYGGRGISVCERWLNFENFYADMGDRPAGKSLDRIDNEKDYGPDNCRWATAQEQALNRRSNVLLTVGKETKPLSVWAYEAGMNPETLKNRLKKGWEPTRAVSAPVAKQPNRAPGKSRTSLRYRAMAATYLERTKT